MLFDDLKVKFDIQKKHFFKFLQLRSFILTRLKHFGSLHCPHWSHSPHRTVSVRDGLRSYTKF